MMNANPKRPLLLIVILAFFFITFVLFCLCSMALFRIGNVEGAGLLVVMLLGIVALIVICWVSILCIFILFKFNRLREAKLLVSAGITIFGICLTLSLAAIGGLFPTDDLAIFLQPHVCAGGFLFFLICRFLLSKGPNQSLHTNGESAASPSP